MLTKYLFSLRTYCNHVTAHADAAKNKQTNSKKKKITRRTHTHTKKKSNSLTFTSVDSTVPQSRTHRLSSLQWYPAEQQTVLKQGRKKYGHWSDRVLTVDTENGYIYLSKKNHAQNTTYHKMYVERVQTWPNCKPRYVVEKDRSREAMLTFRVRGTAVDAAHDERARVSESREKSPSLRASRMQKPPTPARAPMSSPIKVPPAAAVDGEVSCEQCSTATPPEGKMMPASDSTSCATRSPSVPASPTSPLSTSASTLSSRFSRAGLNSRKEWWMMRTTSLSQLAKALLLLQHMVPEKYNVQKLLAPAQACVAATSTDDF